ncbi:hypothetical protein VRRI112168_03750 [Vreelandella rituensis]|uniref:Uncharacterized protein n=1 Tax=Vreelandella rituensis TaxID=2282306 RepID=A0A368U9Z0_9GAMM|nr:hypothetical protein [Halomonas rituensis]RCV93764.1 hypothetical protein DU506_01005 [Halomonas rituensis]
MTYQLFADALKDPSQIGVMMKKPEAAVGLEQKQYFQSLIDDSSIMSGEGSKEPMSEAMRLVLYGGEKEPDTGTFTTLLPFAPFQVALDKRAKDPRHPLSFATLTGKSPDTYFKEIASLPRSSIKRLRKSLRGCGTFLIDQDLLLLLSYLARPSHRLFLLEHYLAGKNAPVIEHDILNHWMQQAGVEFESEDFLSVPASALIEGQDLRRIKKHQQYLSLLFPVLDSLKSLTPEQNETPDALTWATFNAWWAIASLYKTVRFLSDLRMLWPGAHDMMVHTAFSCHGDSTLQKCAGNMPRVTTSAFKNLHHIQRLGNWLANTATLLGCWKDAGTGLNYALEQWSEIEDESREFWFNSQRYLLDNILFRGGSSASIGSNAVPTDNVVRQLAGTLIRIQAGSSNDQLASDIERLGARADFLDKLIQEAGECRGVIISRIDAPTPTQAPSDAEAVEQLNEMHDPSLLPDDLVPWFLEVESLDSRLVEQLTHWESQLDKLGQQQDKPIAERMAALQAQANQYEAWKESIKGKVDKILAKSDKLPWESLGISTEKAQSFTGMITIDSEPSIATEHAEASKHGESEGQDSQIEELREQLHQQEDCLRDLKAANWSLRQHLDNANQETFPGRADTSVHEALKEFSMQGTAPQALALVQASFPERIRVLDTAMESATHSASQLSATTLLQKLVALATDGRDILMAGRPAYEMNDCLPGVLSLNESDNVRNHERLAQERDFVEQGADGQSTTWTMHWHLRIDYRHRLYFAWDDATQQVVIGHAGAHLALANGT